MTKEDTRAEVGTQNWLRTATLLLTILSPVINNLASRLADRLEQGGKRAKELQEDVPGAVQEKVAATRQTLSDTLVELKEHPYSQELLKRGEGLVEELQDLVDRGSKLSQSLIARGSDVTSDLAERGNKASQELVKRSEEARKELRKRGKKLNKELSKRSKRVAKELSKRSDKIAKELSRRSRQVTGLNSGRSGLFWTISGFCVGLTFAGIAAYVLIRRRLQQQQQLEEEQSFQVPQNGYLNTTAISTTSSEEAGSTPAAAQPIEPVLAEEGSPAVAAQENGAPLDAALVGVVGTKRYYLVSTPLDQLSENGKTDVVYFSSEDEAKAEGYTSGV